MRSFMDLDATLADQPRELGPLLARIDTGRGREDKFSDQAPAVLKQLRQDARIDSITASNAIEGIIVDGARALQIGEGAPRFRNRNEREFAGYRDAIDRVIGDHELEPLSIPFVLDLHRTLFQHVGGRGGYLKTDQNFIVSYEHGRREVVFAPPPPHETEFLLGETIDRYNAAQRDQAGHPLVLIGALIVDILAIHPVADANGRLARLITTHQLASQGYGVARYVSLEQRIYDSKHTYYDRLARSQKGWHSGEHTIWPWVKYLASILASAYEELEKRVADASRSGENKQDRVRRYILEQAPPDFQRRDLERALPGVSPATIRLVLNQLRDAGKIAVNGGGPGARWQRS